MSLETETMVFTAWTSLLSLHHSSRDIAHAITLLCRILHKVNEERFSENSGVLYAICACERILRILADFEDDTIRGDFCDMVLDLVYGAFTASSAKTAHYSYALRKASISTLTTLCSSCSKIPAFFDSPMIEEEDHANSEMEGCRQRSRVLSSLLVDISQWEIQEEVEEKVVSHHSFATEGAKQTWEPKSPKSPKEDNEEKSLPARRVEVKAEKIIHTGFSDSDNDEEEEKEKETGNNGDVVMSRDVIMDGTTTDGQVSPLLPPDSFSSKSLSTIPSESSNNE